MFRVARGTSVKSSEFFRYCSHKETKFTALDDPPEKFIIGNKTQPNREAVSC